jgi:histidyl-tRNA synthetase
MGMRLALVLGPDEQAQGTVAIKDLLSGEQRQMPRSEMLAAVRSLIER